MKKLCLVFGVLVFATSQAHAIHQLIFRDASSLTTGTVSNSLLDVGSVTFRGNLWDDQVDESTTAFHNRVVVATASIVSKLINGPITTYDDRRPQLNATTLNFDNNLYVDSGIGGTITIRGTDKAYDLKIGTYGTEGVDMYVDNVNQWNMALSSVGISVGMVFNSTYNARILSLNQNALMSGATIPQGVKVYGGSSSTWVDNGTAVTQFLRIYGEVYNMNLNLSGLAFSSSKIQMSSGSKLVDSTIYGAYNQLGSILNSHAILVNGINIDILNSSILDAVHLAGVAMYGDASPVRILSSSNVIVDFKNFNMDSFGSNNRTNMQISLSTGVAVSGNFRMAGDGINFAHGNVDCGIKARPNGKNTYIEYPGASGQMPDVGVIIIGEASGTSNGTSTSAYITNVDIVTRGNDTANVIRSANGAGKDASGIIIKNVTVRCSIGNSITAISLAAQTVAAVIDNVDVYGCSAALADSGRGTNKAGLRLNAVTQ